MNYRYIIGTVLLLIFLLIWEFAGKNSVMTRLMVSSPSLVAEYSLENASSLLVATLTTLQESALGFLLAIGIALGLFTLSLRINGLLGWILPFLIGSQVVPLIVLAPFFTIALGYGMASKITMAAVLCFFPIFMGFVQGYKTIPQTTHDLLSVHEASPSYRILRVYLPMCLPSGMAGLKVGSTLAVIGAIVAEFSGAQYGLGKNLFLSTTRLDPELMVSSIALSSMLGATLFGCVHLAERLLGRWYITASDQNR